MWWGSLPARCRPAISRRFGRRVAFVIGTGLGTLTGLLGSLAILHGSFALFCAATFLGGLYGAVAQSYRFAAADGASAAYRPKAVSWVMAGGVFAGVLGPQLVQWTMDVWPPYLFAFSFLVQAAVALVAMGIVAGVDMPKPAPADLHGGRPLLTIVTQPRFIAAALCGVISYPMMNLVMTSAPLAMKMCGLSVSDSNFGLQWHIVAMYGPSFFTGALIARFGAPRIVAAGLLLEAGAAGIGLSGLTAMQGVLQYARFILSELKAGRRLTRPVHLFGMDKIAPHPQARYTKPILVLVNETDFSAGDFFPAILQDNGRAKIFGVRTAGAGGGVKSVEFPNQVGIAGLSYTWTIAERPNGQPIENLGVTPDIAYQITADDLRTDFSGYKAAVNAGLDSMIPVLPQAGTAAPGRDEGPSFYPDDDGYMRRPGAMAGAGLLGFPALTAAAQPAQLLFFALILAALGTALFIFNLAQAIKAWKQMKARERSHDRLLGDLKKLK